MNPYDFVPIDFNQPIARRPPVMHAKFESHAISGQLTGTITAETPIFIKSGNSDQFIRNKDGKPIIPGTSLKGLFRSIVETVANGCLGGKCDRQYKDKHKAIDYSKYLPVSFLECTNAQNLCIACRIFGMQGGTENVFAGKVSFEDAVCVSSVSHPPVYTIDLMGPKPYHRAFYLDRGGNRIAGRKFYFHHPQGIQPKDKKTAYNQRIQPLGVGSKFTFHASFTNLEPDEWEALLYAITLEPTMRHKIGYAKPFGTGSVKIDITHIREIDYSKRYTSPNRGITELQGEALTSYIASKTQCYKNNTTSRILNELRRIWRWDVKNRTVYRYPTVSWFKDNPNAPISQTP